MKASALHQQGDHGTAKTIYRQVLDLDPDEPNAWHLLGVMAWQEKDLLTAESYVRKAVGFHDKAASYLMNLGGILRQKGDFEESIQEYEKALKIEPGDKAAIRGLCETLHQYALALTEQQKWPEVQAAYQRVLEFDPGNIATLNNLAAIFQYQNDRDQACVYFNKALALEPNNLLLLYNRSICYLTEQRFKEGWADFTVGEPHWKKLQDKRSHLPWDKIPLWKGQDLKDKTILVWGDQGIGDEIVYASLVPELVAKGALVTLECNSRLVPVLSRSFPQVVVVPRHETPVPGSNYDFQAPGMWLACQLRPNKSSFSQSRAFLKADPAQTSRLRERYKAYGKKVILGLSWYTASPAWGVSRSVPLPDMLKTLPLADTLIIDMQYGNTESAWNEAKRVFPDLTVLHDPEVDQFTDMDIFTSQIAACDVIYTISNTTSHVAGALGTPSVILMSNIGLTWYWFSEGDRSPWYPSLRLLRPDVPNRYEKAAQLIHEIKD